MGEIKQKCNVKNVKGNERVNSGVRKIHFKNTFLKTES